MVSNILREIGNLRNNGISWFVANAPVPKGWIGRKCHLCGTTLKATTDGHENADEADPLLYCPNPECDWDETEN